MTRSIYFLLIAVHCVFCGRAFAQEVGITKTFDSERIVDYTLEYTRSGRNIHLRYTFEKDSKVARIKYDPSPHKFEAFSQLKPALKKLVEKAKEISKGTIIDFMTFEFLGCNDIAKHSVIAFHDSTPWKQYLINSKKKFVIPPYEEIKKTMIRSGIFKELIMAFAELGYRAEFASFEKLAVRKANQFSFANDLVQYGIDPEDEFPIPLMLYFRITER